MSGLGSSIAQIQLNKYNIVLVELIFIDLLWLFLITLRPIVYCLFTFNQLDVCLLKHHLIFITCQYTRFLWLVNRYSKLNVFSYRLSEKGLQYLGTLFCHEPGTRNVHQYFVNCIRSFLEVFGHCNLLWK